MKEIKNKNNVIKKIKSKLENANFINNASHDIIIIERRKLGILTEELDQIQNQHNNL